MKTKHLFAGALCVALTACGGKGGPDQEQIHEKTGSTQQAVQAGWEVELLDLESEHALGNDLELTYEISAPDTSRKFRIFFPRIQMERGYDFLVIRDEFGTEVERITGSHRNYVSKTIRGKNASIVLETDYSVSSWGFEVAHLRHRGCTHNDPTAFELNPVAGCTDLQDEIRRLARAEIRRRFNQNQFYGPIRPFDRVATAEAAPAAPAHSETNVQVAGVDEADIVKTDGYHIYQVAGRQLRVFDSFPAEQSALVHSVDIEGWPKELFLDGTRAIVLSGVQNDFWMPQPWGPNVRMMMPIWWSPEAFTKVTVINFAGGAPVVESETLLAGWYNTARRIGSSVRIVLQRNLQWPDINYYPTGNVEYNSSEWEDAMDQLEGDAIRRVDERVLADWIPTSYRIVNGQRVALPIGCDDFFVPGGDDEMGLMAVATLNLQNTAEPSVQETSALVNANQVYQSLDNLYVTSNHRWSCYEDAGTKGAHTYIHKFDVSDASEASYSASGGVPGSINDQFWMDEHDSVLRVATTNNRWSAELPADRTTNQVFTLGERFGALEQVGQTAVMAPGESIFGVRFLEDRGFVVTFRRVDPLFTIDLSNPANPEILGELKVPGFSTYLHPLDEDHLFTIGQDFETDGTTRNGVALSIFNVADMTNPRLVHKAVIGTTRGYSEALYDHKAFTMYREPGTNDAVLAIPFTDYNDATGADYWSSFVSSVKVFRVSPLGILGLGEIDHSDLFVQNEQQGWGWWYRPNVRRGVFVEDAVYAVSDAGLKVARINDLATIIAAVSAPAQYEDPNPTTIDNENQSASPSLTIPDADKDGVSTTLTLAKDISISSITVNVDIEHTYRGDLEIILEHGGIQEVLFNKTGGSANDVREAFRPERFRGMNSQGEWTLRVVDHARADIGTIRSWSIDVRGEAGTGGTNPVNIERSYENTTVTSIPDNDRTGIESVIDVPDGLQVETLELTVDITHTYRGDLEVILEHDGVEHTVHAQTGGSRDNLSVTVSVDTFSGADARGRWTLRVVDHARADVGTLNTWRMTMSGTQLGS